MTMLTLQMQTSVDGYVAAARPELQWTVWDWGPEWTWDDDLKRDFNAAFGPIDTILLSRKMAEEGYVDHWTRTAEAHADDPRYAFARRVVELPKVVVTSRPMESRWPRTTIASGALVEQVHAVKDQGRAICFGGAGFASALVRHGLVDEYQLYVNPTAVGAGTSVFATLADPLSLMPIGTRAYDCGIVVNRFRPGSA
jgi:dihydrofolate reductase